MLLIDKETKMKILEMLYTQSMSHLNQHKYYKSRKEKWCKVLSDYHLAEAQTIQKIMIEIESL